MNRVWWMFVILAVLVLGSGAISIVWLRMEISATAKSCGKLEDQREMVARELQELRGLKSRLLRPSMVAQLVAGRLRVPSPDRTIYVTAREVVAFENSKFQKDQVSRGALLSQR